MDVAARPVLSICTLIMFFVYVGDKGPEVVTNNGFAPVIIINESPKWFPITHPR